MDVVEGLESAADHLVGKKVRRLHPGNPRMELLPEARCRASKMTRSPRPKVRDHARRQRPLFGERHGRAMDRNIAGEVEA